MSLSATLAHRHIFALFGEGEAAEENSLDDTRSLDRFLASVEKRAFQIAKLAVRDADDALDIVQDAMLQLARRYGALWSIGPLRIAKRHTFVIDPDGRIARIYRNVKPATHSHELQQDIKTLQQVGPEKK